MLPETRTNLQKEFKDEVLRLAELSNRNSFAWSTCHAAIEGDHI
jgi:hypothetical protein